MADNLKKTGKADDIRIDAGQGWECAYWTRKLTKLLKRKVTRKELREACEKVGPMAANVLAYLKGK